MVFVYLFLTLFAQPSSVFASENFVQNSQVQYFIASTKTEETALNRKEKEYYTIFDNRSKSEITNPSGKNNYFGFGSFTPTSVDNNITDNFITRVSLIPLCISHNISPNLKNAIYTRAP